MQRFVAITGDLATEWEVYEIGDFGDPASCVTVLVEEEDPEAEAVEEVGESLFGSDRNALIL